MTILSKNNILDLIEKEPPLFEGYIKLEDQLQPNGVDLTLREVFMFQSPGRIGVDNSQRILSDLAALTFDGLGSLDLICGAYLISYNEVVNLPKDVSALVFPRSSLLRCGATIYTAVWDAGYHGRGQALMTVYNSNGIRLQRNARIAQMVFYQLDSRTDGYQGAYQDKNI